MATPAGILTGGHSFISKNQSTLLSANSALGVPPHTAPHPTAQAVDALFASLPDLLGQR
jgi:hypothetical protein